MSMTLPAPIVVRIDDYLWSVNPDTGEVLDMVGHAATREEFCITDQGSAEWVMRHMRAEDSELAGLLHGRETEIADVKEQWDRRIKRQLRCCLYWRRWDAQLHAWARTQLEGRAEKSLDIAGGKIGSAIKTPGLEITDALKAEAFARDKVPEAITVTKVSITKEPAGIRNALTWLQTAAERGITITYDVLKDPLKRYLKAGGVIPREVAYLPKPTDEWYVMTGIKLPSGTLLPDAEREP